MRKTPSIHIGILIAFLVNTLGILPLAQAQDFHLPVPGVMVHLSPPLDPPILKGIKVHPDNPFKFDFILDRGDSSLSSPNASVGDLELKEESTKLIKYFLASLTIPEKDLWVNLSPYEKDRIIPNSFGLTEMGRDLLAEDYMLKQITASLIYPEGEVGKRFWKRIYEESSKKFGTTDIPVNTFNKVWIVPEKAVVYENAQAGTAYVVESKLKVMLEQDYLSLQKHTTSLRGAEGDAAIPERTTKNDINTLGSQIVREIVIPELTKEVNEDKNFSQLRQVYNSLILATWYKKKIKDSILEQVYADKKKVAGITYNSSVIADHHPSLRGAKGDAAISETELIYHRYLQAFKKGVYNYIKEEQDPVTQETIPRKYFSGGLVMDAAQIIDISSNTSFVKNIVKASVLVLITAALSFSMPHAVMAQNIDHTKQNSVVQEKADYRAIFYDLNGGKRVDTNDVIKAVNAAEAENDYNEIFLYLKDHEEYYNLIGEKLKNALKKGNYADIIINADSLRKVFGLEVSEAEKKALKKKITAPFFNMDYLRSLDSLSQNAISQENKNIQDAMNIDLNAGQYGNILDAGDYLKNYDWGRKGVLAACALALNQKDYKRILFYIAGFNQIPGTEEIAKEAFQLAKDKKDEKAISGASYALKDYDWSVQYEGQDVIRYLFPYEFHIAKYKPQFSQIRSWVGSIGPQRFALLDTAFIEGRQINPKSFDSDNWEKLFEYFEGNSFQDLNIRINVLKDLYGDDLSSMLDSKWGEFNNWCEKFKYADNRSLELFSRMMLYHVVGGVDPKDRESRKEILKQILTMSGYDVREDTRVFHQLFSSWPYSASVDIIAAQPDLFLEFLDQVKDDNSKRGRVYYEGLIRDFPDAFKDVSKLQFNKDSLVERVARAVQGIQALPAVDSMEVSRRDTARMKEVIWDIDFKRKNAVTTYYLNILNYYLLKSNGLDAMSRFRALRAALFPEIDDGDNADSGGNLSYKLFPNKEYFLGIGFHEGAHNISVFGHSNNRMLNEYTADLKMIFAMADVGYKDFNLVSIKNPIFSKKDIGRTDYREQHDFARLQIEYLRKLFDNKIDWEKMNSAFDSMQEDYKKHKLNDTLVQFINNPKVYTMGVFTKELVSRYLNNLGKAQPVQWIFEEYDPNVQRSSLKGIKSLKETIYDPDNPNSIWKSISPTEVALKKDTIVFDRNALPKRISSTELSKIKEIVNFARGYLMKEKVIILKEIVLPVENNGIQTASPKLSPIVRMKQQQDNLDTINKQRKAYQEKQNARKNQKILTRDKAMSNTGGIDFNPAKLNLQIQNSGWGIKFHIDPAMLAQLQNAPGFTPVIINMQPLKSLQEFLGINQTSSSPMV